jgi:hypothetical protein
MTNNFQQLFLQILEDNSAAPGGAFGPNDAYSPENSPNLDTKMSMYITGGGNPTKKKKKQKSPKFPLIRRNLNRSL